jgi:putative endonuclease
VTSPRLPATPSAPQAGGSGGDPRRELGRLGEALAAEHLCQLGYAELARNERTRHGEIDLIACDGHTIVFAEVKTRRMGARQQDARPEQEPLAGLGAGQRARLRRLAAAWLAQAGRHRPGARTIRFDAIGVVIDTRGELRRLEHIESAW